MRSLRLLGLHFADLDAAQAAAWIAARPATSPFGYVVTPNADHLVRLARHPALMQIYREADLRLLDSRVVAYAARAIGLKPPRVATGSDVTALLMARHLRRGERITIVGLRPAWLPALTTRCRLAPPFHCDPPFGFEQNAGAMDAIVHFVLTHPTRLVFLALGSPRQEMLAAAIARTGQATGTGLCIGASLEFLAGVRPRAPAWMQRSGLEWLFRLATDPRRLGRRYLLDCPAILPLLLRERFVSAGAPVNFARSHGQEKTGPYLSHEDQLHPRTVANPDCRAYSPFKAQDQTAGARCSSARAHSPREDS